MCQTGTSGEALVDPAAQQEARIKTRLNPGAVEFRSDSSPSEASSPVLDRGGYTELEPVSAIQPSRMEQPTIMGSYKPPSADYIVTRETQANMPRSNSGQFRQRGPGGAAQPRRRDAWEGHQVRFR